MTDESDFKRAENFSQFLRIGNGKGRYGEQYKTGISEISIKITPQEYSGLLVIENTFHARGGPAKHMHLEQDEWFYVLEGIFAFEVGFEHFTLRAGNSLLGPRKVPHVWANISEHTGRLLISFLPAGNMHDFFREVGKSGKMPAEDPALWERHGMQLLGAPLEV